MEVKIDCRGLDCPQPVINTKKALDNLKEGTIVTIVDNEVAKENVRKLANKLNAITEIQEKSGEFHISITKGQVHKNQEAIDKHPGNGELVILIGNDKMGVGANELGDVLIKGYLYTLTEVDPKPNKLIFINNGVKLNCKGSNSIENIKKLEEMGVEILSCGTCLDYYGLKDELQVGSISNMYTIAESLNQASKTVVL
jgi:selenium metabolism protein YedF